MQESSISTSPADGGDAASTSEPSSSAASSSGVLQKQQSAVRSTRRASVRQASLRSQRRSTPACDKKTANERYVRIKLKALAKLTDLEFGDFHLSRKSFDLAQLIRRLQSPPTSASRTIGLLQRVIVWAPWRKRYMWPAILGDCVLPAKNTTTTNNNNTNSHNNKADACPVRYYETNGEKSVVFYVSRSSIKPFFPSNPIEHYVHKGVNKTYVQRLKFFKCYTDALAEYVALLNDRTKLISESTTPEEEKAAAVAGRAEQAPKEATPTTTDEKKEDNTNKPHVNDDSAESSTTAGETTQQPMDQATSATV